MGVTVEVHTGLNNIAQEEERDKNIFSLSLYAYFSEIGNNGN